MTALADRPKRILWVDVVRGMAAIAIVFSHVFERLLVEGQIAGFASEGSNYGDLVRMPAIIFVSGFFLQGALMKGTSEFVWSKFSKVAWPFLLWIVIYYVLWHQIGLLPTVTNPIVTAASLLLKPILHLWFLQHLLIFFAISWLTLRNGITYWRLLALTAALALPTIVFGSLSTDTISAIIPNSLEGYIDQLENVKKWLSRFGTTYFFFNLGVAARHYGAGRVERQLAPSALWIAIGANAIVLSAATAFSLPKFSIQALPFSLVAVLGFVSAAVVLGRIEIPKKVLTLISGFSLEVYILHLAVIMFLQRALNAAGLQLPDLAEIVGLSAITIPICLGLALFSRRFLGNVPFSLPPLAARRFSPA